MKGELFSTDEQTIVAQCTPKGSGALALIRLSGCNVFDIISDMAILPHQQTIISCSSHTIHYGRVVDQRKKTIDQVMFLVMRGPRTFTGQDTIEITSHNNQFIIDRIIERAIACGARLAHEGEFTKRAVLNNKIDLIQAEAINDVIHAPTPQALKKSLAQLDGTLSRWIHELEEELVKMLAFSEASFEFIDEEITFDEQIRSSLRAIRSRIAHVKKSYTMQKHIKEGFRIALLGSVNAGKSSLFNALTAKNRAIVTNKAGTTRDVIEETIYQSGTFWTFVDTAGLRTTDDEIEQEGIKRSFEQAQTADLILLVYDASRTLTAQEHEIYAQLVTRYAHKIMVVAHKSDLPIEQENPFISHQAILVSSQQPETITPLLHNIEGNIKNLCVSLDTPFLLNKRQFNLLVELERKIKEIETVLHNQIQYEILSFHLQDALSHLSEMTGKSISERGMDAVFREFCVGK